MDRENRFVPTSLSGKSDSSSKMAGDEDSLELSPRTCHESIDLRVGLLNPDIAEDRQRMLSIADRLRSVGAQAEINIPQIVVIGTQNTGKSSLLHRISGVPLQISSGTCTRVPSEIILQNAGEGTWECTVNIRFIKDASGERLGKPRIKPFGTAITNPSELQARMINAQLACLNPSRACTDFLDGPPSLNGKSELSFSDNCVVVLVRGPNIPNLSLCDLPGLIASVTKSGNENDINMIEQLVISYIENSNCLILLTVTCESDFETQGAYRLATKCDPEGRRTIGVLTKPDRIPPGDEHRWVDLVKNETEALEMGWFCVKQPDTIQVSAGITLAEAREAEDVFFAHAEPWCSLPTKLRSRLGTDPLVERLSDMLAELISQRLPGLREEVERMIFETKNDLKELPVPTSEDPLAEATVLIMEFSKEIDYNVRGLSRDFGIIQNVNSVQDKLKSVILSKAPKFLPYEKGSGFRSLPAMRFLKKEGFSDRLNGISMYLDEVMTLMENTRTRELPGHISSDVTGTIIRNIMKEWAFVANKHYDKVLQILNEFIKPVVDRYFKRYRGLHDIVRSTVNDLLSRIGDETQKSIDKLRQREEEPFTLNSCYYTQYKDDFLAYYKSCRQVDLNGIAMQHIEKHVQLESSNASLAVVRDDAVSQILAGLNTINIRDVKASDLPKLHKDPFDPALEVMAMVSAYYQVAAKRFIDSIALAVDYELVRAFAKEIHRALYEKFNKGDGRENCAVWMRESPSIRRRRQDLHGRLERLEAAKCELTEYSLW